MGVYENLLPGKENALTPEYLTVKCCKFCSNGTPILKSAVHSF